jgi:hypothetical protein
MFEWAGTQRSEGCINYFFFLPFFTLSLKFEKVLKQAVEIVISKETVDQDRKRGKKK